MPNQTIKSTGCCEPFNPEPWQDKEIIWQDKIFINTAAFWLIFMIGEFVFPH